MSFQLTTTWRHGVSQTVAYTAALGTITTAVGSQTRAVMVTCTTAAFVKIGTAAQLTADPVDATGGDIYMPANVPRPMLISPGEKVQAIQAAAGGNLHVTELTL